MKSIKETENLSFEQLESIASDNGIRVPEDLQDSVQAALVAKGLMHRERLFRPAVWIGSLATAAAVCTIAVLGIKSEPKDSFETPEQAYAQLEQTFAYISSKVEKGYSMPVK